MSPYRFSWDAVDDRTVAALAEAYGHDPLRQAQNARVWLSARVKRPTPEFVREKKDALVRTWLATYVGTKHIVDRLGVSADHVHGCGRCNLQNFISSLARGA
jgi:hypothetical protein